MKIKVEWTGSYPCKCIGEWKLEIDGKDFSDKIPEELRDCPMDTFGTYQRWHFVDWIEEFEDYQDGLECDEWIWGNLDWLEEISTERKVLEEIYAAFQAEDWRPGECGGCI